MPQGTIRSSTQLWIDASLDHKSQKGINMLPGTVGGDAVEFNQMNTAISNAVSGVGNSIHVPVQDLLSAKAVNTADRSDKMIMLIENLGLYRFDAEMIAASNDNTIIRPTDVATDAAAGRWIKISATITDHDNLSSILGNGTYHLSLAERDKLTGIAANANNYVLPFADNSTNWNTAFSQTRQWDGGATGLVAATGRASLGLGSIALLSAIGSANITTNAVGAAALNVTGNGTTVQYLKSNGDGSFSWATPIDTNTVYTHPNHTGEASSSGDGAITLLNSAVIGKVLTGYVSGAGTISATDTILGAIQKLNGNNATNANLTGPITSVGNATTITANAVTLAMMSTVVTATFLGRTTAGTGNVEAMTVAQAKALLGYSASASQTRTYRATPTGVVNGSNAIFTIAALVVSGTEEVFKNGVLMNAGAGNDYTIAYAATTTITFLTAPQSAGFTDVILVSYSV